MRDIGIPQHGYSWKSVNSQPCDRQIFQNESEIQAVLLGEVILYGGSWLPWFERLEIWLEDISEHKFFPDLRQSAYWLSGSAAAH